MLLHCRKHNHGYTCRHLVLLLLLLLLRYGYTRPAGTSKFYVLKPHCFRREYELPPRPRSAMSNATMCSETSQDIEVQNILGIKNQNIVFSFKKYF